MQRWLEGPVRTNKDVLTLVRSYHETVIRPETYHLVLQLETALAKVGDDLFKAKQEFVDGRGEQGIADHHEWLATGHGPTKPPLPDYVDAAAGTESSNLFGDEGFITDHTASEGNRWLNALSVEPVTVPNGKKWYSGMTLLTFKAFELRSAFLEKYRGSSGTPLYSDSTTPITGKHIRVSPSSPQWQRKLEAPISVLLQVLNKHADHTGKSLVILWKTLTLMEPSTSRDFNGDAVAWARLFFAEVDGSFRGRLEITPPMKDAMASPSTMVRAEGDSDPDLWTECWNDTMWGGQYDLDRAESEAYKAARDQTALTGKGIQKGKGRKHWSQTMVHNDYFMPYPFVLDEYCQKVGRPDECVGDLGCSTYQGKPAVPPPSGDAEMAGPDDQTTPPTTFGGKGSGAEATPHAKSLRNKAKRLARKDRIKWIHDRLVQDPGKRSHLVVDGKPIPWSREAARDMGPNIFEQSPEEPPFTIAELQTALTKLKKNKAPGPDGITNELYGLLDAEGELNLLQLYNDILTTPHIPEEWYLVTVVSIFKGPTNVMIEGETRGPDYGRTALQPLRSSQNEFGMQGAAPMSTGAGPTPVDGDTLGTANPSLVPGSAASVTVQDVAPRQIPQDGGTVEASTPCVRNETGLGARTNVFTGMERDEMRPTDAGIFPQFTPSPLPGQSPVAAQGGTTTRAAAWLSRLGDYLQKTVEVTSWTAHSPVGHTGSWPAHGAPSPTTHPATQTYAAQQVLTAENRPPSSSGSAGISPELVQAEVARQLEAAMGDLNQQLRRERERSDEAMREAQELRRKLEIQAYSAVKMWAPEFAQELPQVIPRRSQDYAVLFLIVRMYLSVTILCEGKAQWVVKGFFLVYLRM
ncbi:unnamed protein product [Symbiodinium sp. KB8]|nr:unnamed protein product [Symbiodinium sp. KB8]